jgi:hypothetical protein
MVTLKAAKKPPCEPNGVPTAATVSSRTACCGATHNFGNFSPPHDRMRSLFAWCSDPRVLVSVVDDNSVPRKNEEGTEKTKQAKNPQPKHELGLGT